MATLQVLSAGAAQAVVQQVIALFTRDTGVAVTVGFGAVGAMKAKALEGAPLDVLVLTDTMIDELVLTKFLVQGRHDLGKVGTGVAVRAGAAKPNVANADALRASLRAASVITFPDPAVATAGKIVMRCLEKLGIAADVKAKLKFFSNGNAAMNWMATEGPADTIGITQNTEIFPIKGVDYIAPLPDEFQAKATYSAGRAVGSTQVALADDFVARLTSASAKPMLAAAGFEF